MYFPTTSLTDPPLDSPIADGVAWVQAATLGSTATAIAVIAVAAIGLLALSGRIELRRSVSVVIGSFLLFGAAGLASGLTGGGTESLGGVATKDNSAPLKSSLISSGRQSDVYDPYAGASVPSPR
jgi:type IV secretory pathway VirB2 component (pilin)